MKRAVVFLHGDKPKDATIKKYLKKSDTIICADGGAVWAVSMSLKPDVYIGDLDSISPTLAKKLQKEKIEWLTYPKEKDKTDSELALEYARKKGFREILVFGFSGSRLDHMLANLEMFGEASHDQMNVTVITDDQELSFITYQTTLRGIPGEYISLIPLKDDVKGVTTKGLKWRLYNDTLYFGSTLGISNEFVAKKAEIAVDRGILLVVRSLTGKV